MKSVSVIVAAYNIEDYIDRCINSIINQSFNEIEIVVVNDGSTDGTLKKIKQFKSRDNRIKIIDKNNEGLIEARKTGLKVAKGDYILFVDGDDWLEQECIEKLVNSAVKNDADIVLYNIYNTNGNNKKKLATFNSAMSEKIKADPLRNILLDNILPAIFAKFIKKEFLDKNNIQFPDNISFAEDLALSTNLFINKPKIELLEDSLYNYYYRTDSISRKITNKILEVDEAIEFIKDRLIENEQYEKYKQEFEYMVFRHLFISKILRIETLFKVRKKIYMQYKNRNIDYKKNKYINDELSNGNTNLRIRIKIYDFNYYIGTMIDLLLGYVHIEKRY